MRSDPTRVPVPPDAAAAAPHHPGARPADAALAARQPVSPRADAEVDPEAVRVATDAAVKHNTFPSRPGYPSGQAHWQTHLHVEVWVPTGSPGASVWVDVHVFGHDGALAHSETLALAYARPAGDGGDVFALDRVVYEGATATPGSVTPRPDVRLVQYRAYCERDGRVLTDGHLHECTLRSDASSV